MNEDELISFLLHDPTETMEKIDWSFMKDMKPWQLAANSLQSSPLLPNLFSENQVAERFHVTLRTVRDRARERNLGRKLSGRQAQGSRRHSKARLFGPVLMIFILMIAATHGPRGIIRSIMT